MWPVFFFCSCVIIFSHKSILILLIRSLKLGVVPSAATSLGSCPPFVCTIRNAIVEVPNFSWNDKRSRQGRESSILTRCCLSPLSGDGGAPGYVFSWASVFSMFGWPVLNALLHFVFVGLFWESCTCTISREWIMHPLVQHCQHALLSLIWKLLGCKFISFNSCSFPSFHYKHCLTATGFMVWKCHWLN